MKTTLVLLVFLLSPVFSQGIPSVNGWSFNFDSSMDVDSFKTRSSLKNGFQIFGNYGKVREGRNFAEFNWSKYMTTQTPDSVIVDVFFNNTNSSVTGMWIGLAIVDSNHYWYQLKPLFLDAPFWYPISWDVREAKATISSFTEIYLMFFLISNNSSDVGAEVMVDNLRGIDGTLGTVIYDNFSSSTTGISEEEQIPQGFALEQNYPNPFNPFTTIRFTVPQREYVSLVVFNSLGQEVRSLVEREEGIGSHEVEFDASNLPSGVYFYRLRAGSFVETKRLVLLR